MTGSTGPEVPVERVDLGPGVLAGFTTRVGGIGRPPYDTLNLGAHVGDDPAAVAANRARLQRWAGAPIAFADQVHGARVLWIGPSDLPTDPLEPVGTADAMVTTSPDVALAVLVADCVPVLLADARAGVVAVAHVGRRGLGLGVLPAVLAELVAAGAVPARVRAAIGPAIAGSSYEVPAALRDEIAAVVPEAAATTAWGTPALDLPRGAAAVLARAGVGAVQRSPRDTWADDLLFSYRREGTTGRFVGIVRARDCGVSRP
ncbi:peptidoglycan editing factor PgeF [Cellulomonas composti]|uniref:Purine nucleoside phosphorylase n=1 Tax=Cellulomonas composti TaxID=266130 RepID=A0A511J8B1_9CELL|nr:peptidoglycan editing factor PgeF [Cellulomonas composti]GEL94236.1 laccase domain protein [Cellulomonas composti]